MTLDTFLKVLVFLINCAATGFLPYLLRESPEYFSTKPATSQKITNQELWSLGLILLPAIVSPIRNMHLTLELKILQHVDAIISYEHFW